MTSSDSDTRPYNNLVGPIHQNATGQDLYAVLPRSLWPKAESYQPMAYPMSPLGAAAPEMTPFSPS